MLLWSHPVSIESSDNVPFDGSGSGCRLCEGDHTQHGYEELLLYLSGF